MRLQQQRAAWAGSQAVRSCHSSSNFLQLPKNDCTVGPSACSTAHVGSPSLNDAASCSHIESAAGIVLVEGNLCMARYASTVRLNITSNRKVCGHFDCCGPCITSACKLYHHCCQLVKSGCQLLSGICGGDLGSGPESGLVSHWGFVQNCFRGSRLFKHLVKIYRILSQGCVEIISQAWGSWDPREGICHG